MVPASLPIRPCPSTTPKSEADIIMDQEYMWSVKLVSCYGASQSCVLDKDSRKGVALGGYSLLCVLQWTMNFSITVDTSYY